MFILHDRSMPDCDTPFSTISAALSTMREYIDYDVAGCEESHYEIIDGETGEVISEHNSDNLASISITNIINCIQNQANYIRGVCKPENADEIPGMIDGCPDEINRLVRLLRKLV